MNSRLNDTEEHISDLESRRMKITKTEWQKEIQSLKEAT